MRRRSFFATPAAALAPAQLAAASPDDRIVAFGDGIPLSPAEYTKSLTKLADSGQIQADDYARGGVIEKLETRMATLLGKEAAVWLPTGTLANHLAVRLLANGRRRVLVQAESHLYNDCGDCAQTLSGLNLVPLARGKATFTPEEVERAVYEADTGRVASPVGAIQIETPVRRQLGARFEFESMTRIAAFARERRIGLHLDGARLFIESIYAGRPVKQYAALFDTVYVSMYKYFGAPAGAILAGPKTLLADLYHTRRMFGGGMAQAWPLAAVALHSLEGFESAFRAGKETADAVLSTLGNDPNFSIERIPNGTNVFRLRVHTVNPPVYQLRLEEAEIVARPPAGDWFNLQVNATWTRHPAQEIVARFRKALGY